MFKVNFEPNFPPYSSVSFVNFEQVNPDWEVNSFQVFQHYLE